MEANIRELEPELLEKLLRTSYIPARYWGSEAKNVYFNNFSQERPHNRNTTIKIKAQTQTKWFESLLQSIMGKDGVTNFSGVFACVSSIPTEDLALTTVFYVAKLLMKHHPASEIKVVNLAYKLKMDYEIKPSLVVLYNITNNSTYDRLQAARDWIHHAQQQGSLCLLAATGTNPIDFCDNKLHVIHDAALYSEGQGMIVSHY